MCKVRFACFKHISLIYISCNNGVTNYTLTAFIVRRQDFNEDSFESLPSDHEHRQSIICNTSVAGDVSQSNMSEASKFYFIHDQAPYVCRRA